MLKYKCITFSGKVLRVVDGVDGKSGCIYEVKYDGEDQVHHVNHLLQDLKNEQVRILKN